MDDVQLLLERIQKNVVAEAEQKFADETFQHLRFSLRKGRMRGADAAACVTKSSGEAMEIYLKFDRNRVQSASYLTDGDSTASMCGSCVTEMAIGKTVREMMNLRVSDVIKRIARNGSGVEQSALLAIEGLHKALENYRYIKGDKPPVPIKKSKPQFIAVGRSTTHSQYPH
ncbi:MULTISPECIES: iron-sulfur cluster assembly scaffold protein [Desulfosediminicola]|uniref:iron-sulfur cluster assembly scaffold protein n=1 Tax=Desulfosediminicola TaxID=2886823 RepID=UPI0010AD40DA|nr:iron-sulfur cluster assembly scaffold protein [Desulfosediminicola ganghwensis]